MESLIPKLRKKFLKINELADTKFSKTDDGVSQVDTPNLDKLIDEAKDNVEPVSEEKAIESNTEYEKKMEQFKRLDVINAQLATLIEIEDMVKLSVMDMFDFIEGLEKRFEKEIESDDQMCKDLFLKIKEIKSKY